jgi:ferric-dicitrate binding protein FerR (iron transport regulator)
MTPDSQLELQRLLSALCDGELNETEHARLEELLRTDAESRRLYLEYLDMHARLLMHPQLAAGGRPPAAQSPERNGSVIRPEQERSARRGGKVGQALRYLLVAAGTLAASLLVQAFLAPPRNPVGSSAPTPRTQTDEPGYIATLAQTADCVWENESEARRTGSRLLPGEVRLQQGIARLHFDSGSDLVIEGPAVVRLESATAARVVRGKVVFKGDETAAPFDLHTPSATLVDYGTEYAVVVGPEGEEVHVRDGEVQRTPKTRGPAKPEQLLAGQARHYGPAVEAPGQDVPLDQVLFTLPLAIPAVVDPAAQLLAYEGFDYQDRKGFRSGKATGGLGWTTSWKGFARPLKEGDQNPYALNAKESLVRPGAAKPSVGGCFDYTGFTKYYRQLATPVRMGEDGVYYLSFLFCRYGPPADADPLNTVAVLLRTADELKKEDPRKRLNIGVGKSNRLFTFFDRASAQTPLPLRYGETYLLVAKIVTSSKHPDQVFLRVYGQDEPIERGEPDSWSVVGRPFQTDLVFDYLEVHINSQTRQVIDEVRLGTSWLAVVSPFLRAPPK